MKSLITISSTPADIVALREAAGALTFTLPSTADTLKALADEFYKGHITAMKAEKAAQSGAPEPQVKPHFVDNEIVVDFKSRRRVK